MIMFQGEHSWVKARNGLQTSAAEKYFGFVPAESKRQRGKLASTSMREESIDMGDEQRSFD